VVVVVDTLRAKDWRIVLVSFISIINISSSISATNISSSGGCSGNDTLRAKDWRVVLVLAKVGIYDWRVGNRVNCYSFENRVKVFKS
jgi:hypothetical protein